MDTQNTNLHYFYSRTIALKTEGFFFLDEQVRNLVVCFILQYAFAYLAGVSSLNSVMSTSRMFLKAIPLMLAS